MSRADSRHVKLLGHEAAATIALLGDWPAALHDLRVLLADPRLDLLLAQLGEPEV